MKDTTAPEKWSTGNSYEPFIGRWSRLVAMRFIDWLAPAAGGRWIDIGCGTGALIESILDATGPETVRGVDPSQDYVTFVRDRVTDPRVDFAVTGADQLPGGDDLYDYTVSGLVLNFIPDAKGALQEMKRVTQKGGCIAAYVWDYSGEMQMLRYFWDAAKELDPAAVPLDEGVRFPICRPDPLSNLWEQAALTDVAVAPIRIDTSFKDFDDYWAPFLGGQGPAPTYYASLGDTAREELKTLLSRRLPQREDGSIQLHARAWAVRGQA